MEPLESPVPAPTQPPINGMAARGFAAISGTLVYRDADGNIVGEVPFSGKIPLPEETAE